MGAAPLEQKVCFFEKKKQEHFINCRASKGKSFLLLF